MNDPAISAHASPSEAIAADEASAFEDFFRGQTQNLYAHLCLITGNRAEAEELAQDAFLKVWERWDRVADMEEPVGYLYRTAMNLFRKRYRRVGVALRKTVSVELHEDEFALHAGPHVVPGRGQHGAGHRRAGRGGVRALRDERGRHRAAVCGERCERKPGLAARSLRECPRQARGRGSAKAEQQ
jgi:DNA-directed RNA polymerase specialized sigma24 family protein